MGFVRGDMGDPAAGGSGLTESFTPLRGVVGPNRPPEPTGRTESFTPLVDRIEAGGFTAGPRYATWRRDGTQDWLLILTVGGAGRIGQPDAADLRVSTGDLVLIRPGRRHDYGTAPGVQSWSLLFAHLRPRPEWAALLDWPEAGRGLGHLHVDGEVAERVADALRRAAGLQHSGLALGQQFGLNAIETALLWIRTQHPAAGRTDPRLIAVQEHIGAHLTDPLDVAGLAREVGLSPSRLAHLFSTQLGITPMRFVEQQRMHAAASLLRLTDRPIREIAAAVGYPDPLYFSTRFRHVHGRSPTQHRRQAEDQVSNL